LHASLRRLAGIAGCLALVAGAACRQDMHDQPSYSALEQSSFFPDGSASRLPLPNTVARGHLRDDALLNAGLDDGQPATRFPFPVDESVMTRGQDMYNAFCSHCHGAAGGGDGMVVRRGFTRPPPLSDPRLVEAPLGHLFNVITNGFGAMPEHGTQIQVDDRWAIVAYLRALQLSQSATIDDVPAAERAGLQQAR
jgi:mono/diheme cytochrome c family protein